MSAPATVSALGEQAVVDGVLAALRADPSVRAVLGHPARVFDDETAAPAFPYLRVERLQSRNAGSACVPALEHRVTLAVFSRWGGLTLAKRAVAAAREALETQPLTISGQAIVLQQVLYSDVLRAGDRRAFRGLIQFRIVAEETSP